MTTLDRLPPGTRFALAEMPALTGTLIKLTDGSATVEFDGQPTVRDFETADHEWVRIQSSGRRKTTITRSVAVMVVQ